MVPRASLWMRPDFAGVGDGVELDRGAVEELLDGGGPVVDEVGVGQHLGEGGLFHGLAALAVDEVGDLFGALEEALLDLADGDGAIAHRDLGPGALGGARAIDEARIAAGEVASTGERGAPSSGLCVANGEPGGAAGGGEEEGPPPQRRCRHRARRARAK